MFWRNAPIAPLTKKPEDPGNEIGYANDQQHIVCQEPW